MRKFCLFLCLSLVLSILVVACAETLTPKPFPSSTPTPTQSPTPSPTVTPTPTPTLTPTPELSEVSLSYEVNAYVKQVKGTETKTLQIGEYEITETEEGWLNVACVEVMNTDTVSGTFLVVFSVAEPTFGELSLKRNLELEPGETKVAECPADELGDWSYQVTPSTKVE